MTAKRKKTGPAMESPAASSQQVGNSAGRGVETIDESYGEHKHGIVAELLEKTQFMVSYTVKDLSRRKLLYFVAFSVVFVSILSSLLIDVFVKKGSLIFIKMAEDLEVDAEVSHQIKLSVAGKIPMTGKFNVTRIDEL